MSIVRAMVNQIGREVGRDVYKGMTTKSRNSIYSKMNVVSNATILSQIESFEMAKYDKVSVKNLANLVQLSDKINPNSFDWEESYEVLDKKIDFAKTILDKEHLSTLEELDSINGVNHLKAYSQHKVFVDNLISQYEASIQQEESKNVIIISLLSLFGLNATYINKKNGNLGVCVLMIIIIASLGYYSYDKYLKPHLNHSESTFNYSPEQIQYDLNFGYMGLKACIVPYLILLLVNIANFAKFKKGLKQLKEMHSKLISYQGQINSHKPLN